MPLLHPALLTHPAHPAHPGHPAPPVPSVVSGELAGLAPFAPSAAFARQAPLVPWQCLSDEPGRVDLATLRELTVALADAPQVWQPIVRHHPERRWYTRLLLSATVEVWLIGWYPGQQTEIHDHGGALGALTVTEGVLEEDRFDSSWSLTDRRTHAPGASPAFDISHVHRVANRGTALATTIHAYSPPELPLRYSPTDSTTDSTAATTARVPVDAAPGIPRPLAPTGDLLAAAPRR